MLRRRARHRNADRAGLALSALVLAAGCGGEDEDRYSPVVADPLGKVEFLREADRICHSTEARIEAAADELATQPGGPDPREVERVALAVVIPALETEVRAISAIGAPPGDEKQVAAILAATERGIEEIGSDPRALADGPPPGLRRAKRLAESYGTRECGF